VSDGYCNNRVVKYDENGKLQPDKMRVPICVVDHIERPTEN